jgi:broad specificity phosphatase PhoE
MLRPTPFIFLRHGETDWNREHRLQGQVDVPLNSRGIAQAHDAKERLRGRTIATICSSPLGRAHETARIVNEVLRRPLVLIDELMECNLTGWQGVVGGDWYEAWVGGAVPAGGESYEAFLDRSLAGINKALAHPGPVLIVAHGGVYWAVQRHATYDDERYFPNGVPVHHDPPSRERPTWLTRVLE